MSSPTTNKLAPLLKVENLSVSYQKNNRSFLAVKSVSFEVERGKTLGLVGESGCGKSSTGLAIMRLIPSHGKVWIEDTEVLSLSQSSFLPYRKKIQMIFQNPDSSLNPKLTIKTSLREALALGHPNEKSDWDNLVAAKLKKVGLSPDYAERYPHQFSGGQLQRIGIARALCVEPSILVCDEPVSSLDVSIQAQILDLFLQLQSELSLTLIFISHDLRVVRYLSDHVAVMRQGEIVEFESCEKLYSSPSHDYTKALLSAVPKDLISV